MKKLLLLTSLLVLCTLAYFAPKLATIHPAKKLIENYLSSKFDAKVTFEKCSLHWIGNQTISNLCFENPTTGLLLYADEFVINNSLIETWRQKTLEFDLDSAQLRSANHFRLIKRKKKISVGLSSLHFKLENRRLFFDPTELTIQNSMLVTARGMIDLQSKQLDLTLNIAQPTLCKIFKEAKILPQGFSLEIPIKSNPNFQDIEQALLEKLSTQW